MGQERKIEIIPQGSKALERHSTPIQTAPVRARSSSTAGRNYSRLKLVETTNNAIASFWLPASTIAGSILFVFLIIVGGLSLIGDHRSPIVIPQGQQLNYRLPVVR